MKKINFLILVLTAFSQTLESTRGFFSQREGEEEAFQAPQTDREKAAKSRVLGMLGGSFLVTALAAGYYYYNKRNDALNIEDTNATHDSLPTNDAHKTSHGGDTSPPPNPGIRYEFPPRANKTTVTPEATDQDNAPHTQALSIYVCDPTLLNHAKKFSKSSLEENQFFSVDVTSDQGKRSSHEDAELIALQGGSAFVVVCDGHGGSFSAGGTINALKDKLERDNLLSSEQDLATRIPQVIKEIDTHYCDLYNQAQERFKGFFQLFSEYLECNNAIFKHWPITEKRAWVNASKGELMGKMRIRYVQRPDIISHVEKSSVEVLKEWILKKASEIRDTYKNYGSGTTFVGALIKNGDKKGDAPVVLFNLGVYDKNGNVKQTTNDHKPNDPQEEARIGKAGGKVVGGRIFGLLAVARGLGDPELKKKSSGDLPIADDLVSSDADVFSQQSNGAALTLGHEDFMVIACDGLWDVMSNEEVGTFVIEQLKKEKRPKSISKKLVKKALALQSSDNVTAIVITRKKVEKK